MYNNCEETHHSGGVLSPFVFLLITIARIVNCSCDVTYMAMRVLATTMMQPNAIACGNERMAKLFSVKKLQIQPVTDLCKSPVWY